MGDRVKCLTVVLERDNGDEDVQRLIDAIEMFQGVLKVEKHVATSADYIAKTRALREIKDKLWNFLVTAEGTHE